jgi:hypothetical protein
MMVNKDVADFRFKSLQQTAHEERIVHVTGRVLLRLKEGIKVPERARKKKK